MIDLGSGYSSSFYLDRNYYCIFPSNFVLSIPQRVLVILLVQLSLFPVMAFVEKKTKTRAATKKGIINSLVEGKFQFLLDFDKPNIQFLGIPLHRLAQFSIVVE